jgi:hypothetical protein
MFTISIPAGARSAAVAAPIPPLFVADRLRASDSLAFRNGTAYCEPGAVYGCEGASFAARSGVLVARYQPR